MKLNHTIPLSCALLLSVMLFAFAMKKAPQQSQPKILVFYKTSGYYHESIPKAASTFMSLGKEHNFSVDTTANANYFHSDSLEQYAAIVFLNTTGDVINDQQKESFKAYIQNGGGFMGVHAATDTEYNWPWFNQLVGAQFSDHPEIQEAVIRITDKNHPATSHLPDTWQRKDEWYNFKNVNPKINVIALLDESSYEGGSHGECHPFAWYHEFDGGKAFYTAGGHSEENYDKPLFLDHLLGGLQYVME